MKIAVTGATGFIGRPLVEALAAQGHEIIAAARHAPENAWLGNVRFVPFDMMRDDPAAAFGVPDILIHLAWPGLPNYRDLFHFETNLPASYALIKAMVLAGTGRILVTGTCFEYGMQSGALSEDTPAAPANPYGLAKDTLRKFLQQLQYTHPFILQWARLFYMYGPGQNSKSLLAQLDHAIDKGDKVFNMSGGEQLRDYLPVEDIAGRLAQLVARPECAGVINCGSGQPVSVLQLVERHIAARGAEIALNLGHYPYPDYEPMAFWADTTKFMRMTDL